MKKRPADPYMLAEYLCAYRYAYYCQSVSLIEDTVYDKLEKLLAKTAPKLYKRIGVGSDKPESYPPHVRALAMYLGLRPQTNEQREKSLTLKISDKPIRKRKPIKRIRRKNAE